MTSHDSPHGPIPSPRQLRWHSLEYYGFLHFGPNTFTDKEWGYGDDAPSIFDPTDFDADRIAETARDVGMAGLILTCKHHDGFCLWPSRYTEYSVKTSPWRGGKGDLVREISDACRRAGILFGAYLSPWDRNHAEYGRPAYLDYYRRQLEELTTDYGDLFEVWFDGANGGDGHYGGARETRRIDRRTYYDWPNTWEIVRRNQPDAVMFSDAGPDIRWVGNEKGIAGDPCWSTLSSETLYPGFGGDDWQATLSAYEQAGAARGHAERVQQDTPSSHPSRMRGHAERVQQEVQPANQGFVREAQPPSSHSTSQDPVPEMVAAWASDRDLLNRGDRNGTAWLPAECDVSIRPGWFYHASQDAEVRSPDNLMDLYLKSVGRGANFLLNVPPDRRGCWHENDIASLKEFHKRRTALFATNLAVNATLSITAPAVADIGNSDRDLRPPPTADRPLSLPAPHELLLEFPQPTSFDTISLKEHLPLGQRVDRLTVAVDDHGTWRTIYDVQSVGNRRIFHGPSYTTTRVRLTFEAAGDPAVCDLSVHQDP